MLLDILVFAAHPDDAELAMGGTIAKLAHNGVKVGVIDLTQGEMGTRGSVEERRQEADRASEILMLSTRTNLKLPDGKIDLNDNYVLKIVEQMRLHKPKLVFAPYFNDRHPDHIGTSQIVKKAVFVSGLKKIDTYHNKTKQEPHRPNKIFYFMQTYEFDPTFIVDISDHYQTKVESIKAYETQFYNPESKEPETFISSPQFTQYLEARAKFFGFQIRKDYGEPFFCEEKIELDIASILNK